MSHDTVIDLLRLSHWAHGNAREAAIWLAGPLLLAGAFCGVVISVYIFRGGLFRSVLRKRQIL